MKPMHVVLAFAVLLSLTAFSAQEAEAVTYDVSLRAEFTNHTGQRVIVRYGGRNYTVDPSETAYMEDTMNMWLSSFSSTFDTSLTAVEETDRDIKVWSCVDSTDPYCTPTIPDDFSTTSPETGVVNIHVDFKARISKKKSKRFCKVTGVDVGEMGDYFNPSVSGISEDWVIDDILVEEARYDCSVYVELYDLNNL